MAPRAQERSLWPAGQTFQEVKGQSRSKVLSLLHSWA